MMATDPTSPAPGGTPAEMAVDRDILEGPPPEPGHVRRLGWGFWLAVAFLVFVIVIALVADWLPINSPTERIRARELGRPPYRPSSKFWFGSDKDSRDVFARTIHGARISLIIAFASIAFGMIVGGTLGILAGYFRGWTDKVISFLFLVLLSFPTTVLAVFLTTLIPRTVLTISLIIGLLSVAPIGRLARATTIQYADREFVVAARTLGARHLRIIVRELLPNVIIPMAALALLGVSIAIVAEGTLAFLGLSVQDGLSWGTLIRFGAGSDALQESPWMAFFPIGLLFLTVASLNFAGDRLRNYFDVRQSAL